MTELSGSVCKGGGRSRGRACSADHFVESFGVADAAHVELVDDALTVGDLDRVERVASYFVLGRYHRDLDLAG